MSYSQRPIYLVTRQANNYNAFGINYRRDAINTTTGKPEFSPGWVQWGFPINPGSSVTSKYEYPKLAKFKAAALLSDINSIGTRVTVGHKTGINVLFNTGAARWVDLTERVTFGPLVNTTLKQELTNEVGFSPANNAIQIHIWAILDLL